GCHAIGRANTKPVANRLELKPGGMEPTKQRHCDVKVHYSSSHAASSLPACPLDCGGMKSSPASPSSRGPDPLAVLGDDAGDSGHASSLGSSLEMCSFFRTSDAGDGGDASAP